MCIRDRPETAADASNSENLDDQLSQETLDKKFSTQFKITDKDNFLATKYASRSFSGAGYMLEFSSSNTAVMFASNTSLPLLDEFTIELWICLVNADSSVSHLCSSSRTEAAKEVTGSHALFSVATTNGDFAIICKDGVQVKWDKKHVTPGININEGVWTHLAVTWRTIDGRLQTFAFSDGEHRQSTTFGVMTGNQLSLDGLLVLGRYMRGYMVDSEYDLRGALDELRIWQYAKTIEQVQGSMNVKFDDYREGLVLNVPLDEGMGQTTEGRLYSPIPVDLTSSVLETPVVNMTSVQLLIHSGESPGWAPSGVHMTPLANYSLAFKNSTLEEEALNQCYKWFYEGKLQKYCSTRLVSQALFYYESCLADIADSGSLSHHKLSVSLFGFYCQKVLGIEPCELYGTYDAFPRCPTKEEESKLTPIEIIVISVSSVFFLLFFLIIIIVVCRRRKRRKSEVEQIYVHESGTEASSKYVASVGQGDHPHAYAMRQLLDVYMDADESESDQTPDVTPRGSPTIARRPLVRNPAGAVLPDGEEESAV